MKYLLFIFALLLVSCSGMQEKHVTVKQLNKEKNYLSWCKKEKEKIYDLVEKIKKEGASPAALEDFNTVETKQFELVNKSTVWQLIQPEESVRQEARECGKEIAGLSSEIFSDRDLFSVLIKIEVKDKEDEKYLKDIILDFKRNGVDKDAAARKKIRAVSMEVKELEQKFYSNISTGRKVVEVNDAAMLEGLSEDFVSSHMDKDKVIKISTDWPDYIPVMKYAEKEELRKKLWEKKFRIAVPENTEVVRDLIIKRAQLAQLLGYESYAHYSQEKLMIRNPENTLKFIKEMAQLIRPTAEKELEVLLDYKKKDKKNKELRSVEPWESFFYTSAAIKDLYDIDDEKVRKYFETGKVLKGLFDIASKVYGVEFKRSDREVWHSSVLSYDMVKDGKVLGSFELDLYPRDGKYNNYSMYEIVPGVRGKTVPTGIIIANFPRPGEGRSYLSHREVSTFFHEFGHLLHSLFSGDVKYARYSAMSCQMDFIEVPSQLFEEWTYDADVLKIFATDDNGKVIPDELVKKIKESSEFGKSLSSMNLLMRSMLSLGLFSSQPKQFNFHEYEKNVEKEFGYWNVYDDSYMTESFNHIVWYSSNYYTYLWSLVIAKDLYSEIVRKGIMNPQVMDRYRKEVLSKGGYGDAGDLLKNFLGRPYSFESFEKWLEQ